MVSINLLAVVAAAAALASASSVHDRAHHGVNVRAIQERAEAAAAPAKRDIARRRCTRKPTSTGLAPASTSAAVSSAPAVTSSVAAAPTSSAAATPASSSAAPAPPATTSVAVKPTTTAGAPPPPPPPATSTAKPSTTAAAPPPPPATTSAASSGSGNGTGAPQVANAGTPGSAFTIKFVNSCQQTIWAAVGEAPSGAPNPNGIKFGQQLGPGASTTVLVDNHALGVRAWGRTGCDASGANCATGGCVGGLMCEDAGITSGVIVSEYGYGNFGQYGGERISYDLSHVDLVINLATKLTASDGTSLACTQGSCGAAQAYDTSTDYAADRNSPLGATFTHTFCGA